MNKFKKLVYNKKFIIYLTIIYFALIVTLGIYRINKISYYKNKTLGYFYNINHVNECNKKIYKWYIGIPGNKEPRNLVETPENEHALNNFKTALDAVDKNKDEILLKLSLLIYFIICLIVEWNNKTIKNIEFVKGMDASAIMFISIMIIDTLLQLGKSLHLTLNYYNLIP